MMPAPCRLGQNTLPAKMLFQQIGVAESHAIRCSELNKESRCLIAMKLIEYKKILGELGTGMLNTANNSDGFFLALNILQKEGDVGQRLGVCAE